MGETNSENYRMICMSNGYILSDRFDLNNLEIVNAEDSSNEEDTIDIFVVLRRKT